MHAEKEIKRGEGAFFFSFLFFWENTQMNYNHGGGVEHVCMDFLVMASPFSPVLSYSQCVRISINGECRNGRRRFQFDLFGLGMQFPEFGFFLRGINKKFWTDFHAYFHGLATYLKS